MGKYGYFRFVFPILQPVSMLRYHIKYKHFGLIMEVKNLTIVIFHPAQLLQLCNYGNL